MIISIFKKPIFTLFAIFIFATNVAKADDIEEVAFLDEKTRFTNTVTSLNEQIKELNESNELWKKSFLLREQNYSKNIEKLSKIDQNMKSNQFYKYTRDDYSYIIKLWRSLVENSFVNISGEVTRPQVLDILKYKKFSIESGITQLEINNLNLLHQELVNKLLKFNIDFEVAQEKDALQYNKILLYSGKLRSKLYQRLKEIDDNSLQFLSMETIDDLLKEIQIIPLRWTAVFYSKILEFKSNMHAGPAGYFAITKEISIFVFIFVFFIGFSLLFKKINYHLEEVIEAYKRKRYNLNQSWLLHYLLTLASKLLPWLLIALGVNSIEVLLDKTSIREILELLPYVEYYIYYRILLIFISYSVVRLKIQGVVRISYLKQAKLLHSFVTILRFVFINVCILHTVNAVVGKAIVYSLYLKIFIGLSVICNIYIADLWRKEIFYKMHGICSQNLFNLFRFSFRAFYAPLISLISLYILVLNYVYIFFRYWFDQFDVSKRLSAQFFLAQIKKVNTTSINYHRHDLPKEYIQQFLKTTVNEEIIKNKQEFKDSCSNIDNWIQGRSSLHSMVIYGPYGSGKSTLLASLKKNLSSREVSILSLKTKVSSTEILLTQLKEIIGGEAQSLELLIQEWQATLKHKIIICIDDVHNLFLSQSKGFEALKALMTIINADIENIFWCTTCHRYSWSYISKALNQNQCFDLVVKLEPWTTDELQKLIIDQHKGTQYKLSFDSIFFDINKKNLSDSLDAMIIKFFTILWSKSSGNPNHTIKLWLNLLRYDGKKTIHVGLPPDQKSINFAEMSDELLFVCSTIIRHEMLSFKQLQNIMNYDTNHISRILKTCQEHNIIEKDQHNNFRLNSDHANNVIKTLKRKNYVC